VCQFEAGVILKVFPAHHAIRTQINSECAAIWLPELYESYDKSDANYNAAEKCFIWVI
jgi:pyruvate/2-oxoacid:ferredoxin oxidoreductase alpha subunit